MEKMVRFVMSILVPAFILAGVVSIPVMAQDKGKDAKAVPAAKAPPVAGETRVLDGGAVTKTLVRNDKVNVFEVTFKPGQGGNKNNILPARVVRALQGGTLLRTFVDGKTEKIEYKTGEAKFFEAETKASQLTNPGKTDVVLYVVILREPKK